MSLDIIDTANMVHTHTNNKHEIRNKSQVCEICAHQKQRTYKMVVCVNCHMIACKPCTKRILKESKHTARCCKCKHPWTDEFLESLLSSSWLRNDYRKSRLEIWVEQEKSRISLTMPKVKRVKRLQVLKQEVKQLHQEAFDLKYRIRRLRNEERRIYALQGQGQGQRQGQGQGNSLHYTTRCANVGCKGYVCAEENGQCSACGKITCVHCMMMCHEPCSHICKEEDLLSAQTIRSNTTPCPKCHTPIEKSEGCDQMFCVVCFTAFSYRTGVEERGEVHNPHMYEIQRQLGIYTDLRTLTPLRNIGDVPCGGFPTLQDITKKISRYHPNLRMYSRRLDVLHQVAQVEIRRWRPKHGDLCEDLRIRLILQKISEKRFIAQVGRRHIDNVIKVHYTQILEAFLAASQDVLLRLIQEETPQQGGRRHTRADTPNRVIVHLGNEDGVLVLESESESESGSEDDDDSDEVDSDDDEGQSSAQLVPVMFDDRMHVSELDQIIEFTNKALQSTAIRYGRSFPYIPTMYHGINVLRIELMHPKKET